MVQNYFNYFTEIEEHFVRKRGKHLLISPLDWCLIELWKDQDIPLHVVLRGIDQSFQSAIQKHKKPPKTLFYCHPAVQEAFEQYSDAMIGSDREEEGVDTRDEIPAEKALDFLRHLKGRLVDRAGAPFERAIKRMSLIESEMEKRSVLTVNAEELDHDLTTIQSDLLSELQLQMNSDQLRELKADCKKELRVYRKRLSKEMFERLSFRHLEKSLSTHFDLPSFSLLEVDL